MVEWYRATVDLVAALAWPLVIFGLVVLLVCHFHDEISGLFKRMQEAPTPFGPFKIAPQAENYQGAPTVVDTLARQVNRQLQELEETTRDLEGWKALAWQYAAGYYYEQAYRIIYGTQLFALQLLSTREEGATAEELDSFYQMHLRLTQPVSPGYYISREQFLGWLVHFGLASIVGKQYQITLAGRGLLEYLRQAGVIAYKPY